MNFSDQRQPSVPPIIAIDGPAGAGKSSVAIRLAAELGIPYLDTGAMYRAVGLMALREGWQPPLDPAVHGPEIAGLAEGRLRLEPGPDQMRVFIDDVEVTDEIRSPECSEMASAVSALPEVRRALVPEQRRMGILNGGVMEGRDIGSVVFPDATLKVYLDASAEVRAMRRYEELTARGLEVVFEEVLGDQIQRDLRDSSREDSPLVVAPGAVVLDTSSMNLDEVVERLKGLFSELSDVSGPGKGTLGAENTIENPRKLDSSVGYTVRSPNHGESDALKVRPANKESVLNMDLEINGTNGGGEGTEQLSMEQLLEMETSVQSLKEGEVVRGTVVAISNDEVMVDIGFKCEGTVQLAEILDPETGEPALKVGEEFDVFVERIDAMEGRVYLSRDRAARLKIWTVLEDAFKNEETITGKVLERVKGGLAVDIGIRAFLPGSLVDIRPNRRLEDYIGQEIESRIISFDRRRSNVVLSRKALLEVEVSKIKEETMAGLEEGMLVTGAIKNITDYGVFVDLGGLDGLLHITDISWGRVGHPNEYFKVGDEVEVVILRFDREKERVSLGYKQRFEDPWIMVPEKYPVGKRVSGEVVSVVDYGAFIALEEGVEGLIHVSEMSWTKKIKNPRSVIEIGQEVDVVVSEVDSEKRRLSLSLRATEPNPWETVADTYHVGSRVKGIVRNLTDFGAFVEIVPGVDGLVHISDMSWTRRISHPSEVVQKGQDVNAVVTAVDVPNQRISLSMKELLPNEWEEYANSHGVGNQVPGKVTNITDFGVFIELAPGVEGLCHISELDRSEGHSLEEIYTPGQKVRCRILRIDWNETRIGLSMQSVSQDDADEAYEETADGAGANTAMAAALRAGGILAEDEIEKATAGAETEAAVEGEAAGEETVAEAADVAEVAETAEAAEAPVEAETPVETEDHQDAKDDSEPEPETAPEVEVEPESAKADSENPVTDEDIAEEEPSEAEAPEVIEEVANQDESEKAGE